MGSCVSNHELDGTRCDVDGHSRGDDDDDGGNHHGDDDDDGGHHSDDDDGGEECGPDVCIAGSCVAHGHGDDGDDNGDNYEVDTLMIDMAPGGDLVLSWERPRADAGLNVIGYRVLRRALHGGSWELLSEVTVHSYALPIVHDSRSYLLNVVAITEAH